MFSYVLLLVAVVLMSVVQVIIKLRFNSVHGQIPLSADGFPAFLMKAMKDPYLWLAGITLVTAAILWYSAISRMSLGVAFAFAALSYPLVMAGSYAFLGETFAMPQIMGCALIVGGLVMIAAYT
ncbi:MAG: hypothetical protein ACR2O3_03975 [Rhizobiaceae bacterium]